MADTLCLTTFTLIDVRPRARGLSWLRAGTTEMPPLHGRVSVRADLLGKTNMTTPTRPITVVIADDHPMFREALRKLLESAPDVRVVGEAGNGREAIRLV